MADHDAIVHAGRLLINRYDRALRYSVGTRTHWYASGAAITRSEFRAAVTGTGVLGLYSLGTDGLSRWYALDADTEESFGDLLTAAKAHTDQAAVYAETSRRGGHVWVFHDPAPWHAASFAGQTLAETAGYPDMEVYPRHAGLNAMRVPGSRHPKTGKAYPAVDLKTGELRPAIEALADVRPTTLETVHFHDATMARGYGFSGTTNPGDFADLVALLGTVTRLRVYGPDRAVGRCPWHNDRHPSLYVKGERFHCLAHSCRTWRSITDLKRYVKSGVLPPRG